MGNLRTALLAWLFARAAGAPLRLRVEDLDTGRVRAGCEQRQLADLRALGLDWDGPVVRQSEQGERHAAALARLEDAGLLYPCYCTRAEIRDAASAPHGHQPDGAYPGTCRDLGDAARAQRERSGRPAALRLRTDGETVAVEDRLRGRCAARVDDLVVRRNDGAVAYNLAVVVDDAAMEIGEVVRGADLLETTPRQVHLARLLGLPTPAYAHVPLMLGPDGARLAKRHGAVTLADRAAAGQDAASVRAELARTIGLAEDGERPTACELVARFDPGALPAADTPLVA